MPTGAELFVQALSRLGVNEIFTLVGDHLNHALAAASRADLRIIDMRHEAAVAHAADAWARIHRKPAVALVTGGPGHTNAITGIATAHLASSPLLAISGSSSSALAQRQSFQEMEQVGTVKPIVKWAAQPPSVDQIPFFLGRAYSEANSGRKGAVHLSIPVDLFSATGKEMSLLPPCSPEPPEPSSNAVRQVVTALRGAKRPLIIAGSGVWWGDAGPELTTFIERTSIPLYTITMARGVVSDEHPMCMGYADPALNKAVHEVFREADLILVLGKRIDFRLALGGPRLFAPETRFIQVDIHPQEFGLNRPLEVAVCADVKQTLRALLEEIGESPWPALPWLDRVREARAQWTATLEETAKDSGELLHPAAVFYELKKVLPPDILYSWDGGDFTHWGRAILPATKEGAWLRLGPLATIGAGLPNGLALQLANPGKPVVVITGDGSLGFYIAELDTAVRHKLPFIVIVGNDGGWGIERELQTLTSPEGSVACELRRTRYDIVTQGFGGDGETVDTLDQIGPAMKRALAAGVPYCINVNIRGVRSPFTEWQLRGKG